MSVFFFLEVVPYNQEDSRDTLNDLDSGNVTEGLVKLLSGRQYLHFKRLFFFLCSN